MDRLPPFDKIGTLPVPDCINADPQNGIPGSILNMLMFNQLQHEGVNLQLLAGLAPDTTNLFQWGQAVGRGLWCGNLTGTGDLAVATLGAYLPAFLQGMKIGAVATVSNTTTTPKLRLMNLNGLGLYQDYPILKEDGSALAVGDIKVGRRYRYEADGAGNVLITGGGIGLTTTVSTGSAVYVVTAKTLYVSPAGNDNNDGSAGDAAHAFQTPLAAINAGFKYLVIGGTLLLQLVIPSGQSSATFAAPNTTNLYGRSIQILGDTGNQANFIIQGAGTADGRGLVSPVNGSITLSGLTLNNTGTIATTAQPGTNGFLTVDHVTFTSTASGRFHLGCYGGSLRINTGCIFATSMAGWLEASHGYVEIDSSATLTFASGITWSLYGVLSANQSEITFTTAVAPTIVAPSVTGPKFYIYNYSCILTSGAGLSFYPGNSAGTNNGTYS